MHGCFNFLGGEELLPVDRISAFILNIERGIIRGILFNAVLPHRYMLMQWKIVEIIK